MYPLVLFILGVSGVYSDSHSLRFYYTAVSGMGLGLVEYSTVGYVDDQPIMKYNSDSRLALPLPLWMNEMKSEFWDGQTVRFKLHDARLKHSMMTLMRRFNQTGGSEMPDDKPHRTERQRPHGFHSYQWMVGCELRDDGSTAGYSQYGYDGRDLLYLDTERWVYIPVMHEAEIIAQIYNSPDVQRNWIIKYYLENECFEFLKEFINHGKDDLERRVPPEVKVTGQKSGGVTKLHCRVYGFHPRAVDVKWMKNKQDEVPLDEAQPILPNSDGTYQTRVTVEVLVGEEDNYSCHVDHSSLKKTLSVKWEPKSGHTIGVIIGAVFGCLVVLGIAGFLIYKKKTSEYKTTSTSDASSDSSNITVTA